MTTGISSIIVWTWFSFSRLQGLLSASSTFSGYAED